MTIGADGRTPYGAETDVVARKLDAWGADIIGLNCSVGPQTILECVEKMAPATRRKLSAQPNAGMPRDVGGRSMYMASPEYMATYARHLVQAGAKIVGGCCGTTPEHIHAMVEGSPPAPRLAGTPDSRPVLGQRRAASAVLPFRSIGAVRRAFALGAKLAKAEFVSSVEIVPPRVDASRMIADVGSGKTPIDAVIVPDGPRAQSRMGALLSAVIIEREVVIETVTHYSCRDRNLLGMLSDVLGAAAAGLHNILIVTGDPPKMGPYPDATAVFDIDSIGLTNLVYRLNHGLDPGGNPIGRPTQFAIGVGVNPAATDLDRELSRFAWKVDAGADFAVTQPVFDPEQLATFLKRVEQFRIPIVAGIWPLLSLRNAEFLANEVPGVSVPDSVLVRMRKATEQGKEAALAEGVKIAREMFALVKKDVQGIQVSAPFGRVEVALEVFK